MKIDILNVIVPKGKGDAVSEALSDGSFGFVTMLGRGTAKQQWLNLLGIGDIEKELVSVMMNADHTENAKAILEECFRIGKGGGVAFTLHVQSIADKRVLQYFTDEKEGENNGK